MISQQEKRPDGTLAVKMKQGSSKVPINEFDLVPETEYYSFDYQYHRHLNYWDGMSLCIPLSCISILMLLLLIVVPLLASIFVLIFACITCVAFCGGQPNSRFRIFSRARRARLQIKNQPGLAKENVEGLTSSSSPPSTLRGPVQDWTKASGIYGSLDSPDAGRIQLNFCPFQAVFLQNKNFVWSIHGQSYDDSFVILHGLIAENGKLYWLERHGIPVEDHHHHQGRPTILPHLRRLVLVEGAIDFHTRQFEGTWMDSLGCEGNYIPLARIEGSTPSPDHGPFEEKNSTPPSRHN